MQLVHGGTPLAVPRLLIPLEGLEEVASALVLAFLQSVLEVQPQQHGDQWTNDWCDTHEPCPHAASSCPVSRSCVDSRVRRGHAPRTSSPPPSPALTSLFAPVRDGTQALIPLTLAAATGSGAPGRGAGHNRVPSRDRGHLPATGSSGL